MTEWMTREGRRDRSLLKDTVGGGRERIGHCTSTRYSRTSTCIYIVCCSYVPWFFRLVSPAHVSQTDCVTETDPTVSVEYSCTATVIPYLALLL